MKILITGKNGFIARNLIEYLDKSINKYDLLLYSHKDDDSLLEEYCKECDFVFHLAAVQRSNNQYEFKTGNVNLTKKIILLLKNNKNYVPILFSSSTQIENDSIFAKTKIEAERIFIDYSKTHNVKVFIYRLNHIYGKYGKPNFNNVISTFLYNIANDLPISINNINHILEITYINDLILDFEKCLNNIDNATNKYYYFPSKKTTLTMADLVYQISKSLSNKTNKTELQHNLFNTYMYYYKSRIFDF
ncbi:NAD-dependent epimerase/dehydratase family protein [Beduini massiliensis]|uniref:NAD-dependent epimerase/dehydratase family protein n=1 Tax=Beduini massiliensis TaxID=1585974 RepID=UPI0006945BB3|nr:NAD-dependent epimerase/dehydratase family protein [Beduini massiliensis]